MDSISLLGSSPASTKVCFLPYGLKNGSKEGSGKPTVSIIGSGDFSKSLTLRLLRFLKTVWTRQIRKQENCWQSGSGDFSKSLTLRLLRSGFHVVVGSRQPKRAAESFPHVVDVTHHEDAVGKANIVLLAIRREHYSSLWDIKHLLAGKILVDVSNNRRVNQYPESNAEYLASLFPESIVVKGFNVISSWAMQSGPRDSSRQVYICSNSVDARQQLIELARQLSFIPVDMGALSSAKEIENMPLHLFTAWKGPVLTTVALSIFFFAYSFVRDIIHPYIKSRQSFFYKIPLEIVNRTLPLVAIVLLALVYLAGQLAAAYQLIYGTKYCRFPPWLEGWLESRKQLGLLSFFFGCIHVLYSVCLPMRRSERYLMLNMAYQQKLRKKRSKQQRELIGGLKERAKMLFLEKLTRCHQHALSAGSLSVHTLAKGP
ncbi:metalloreductase STEAP2-like [Sinocyclocheilus rhinocerous]|uniref:metalloreductase STEAP2-like n=1 Tax=Sinocyclocheilus rhinocerous TaxID=307959 RepID=UPI0007BA8CD3|nr:PREDICTED: metalloreductase STEAP2-like [Sinocyclocheilus rhinocerous]